MFPPKAEQNQESPQPVETPPNRRSGCGVIVLFLILFAIVAFIFPEITLGPIGRLLFVQEALEKSDAIVVLLGGDSPERILGAEELYHRGFAPKIVFGSGFVDRETMLRAPKGFYWQSAGDAMKRSFLSLGIPESDLITTDSSDAFDTSGELTVVAEELRKRNLNHVILVTSAAHSRRVQLIFGRVAPDLFAITYGVSDPRFEHWWQYGKVIRYVGYEYAALVKEFVRRVIS